MNHTRKEIIGNQMQYKDEITNYLKKEFSSMKRELKKIKTQDPEVLIGKNKMLERSKRININKEISNYFISWKNVYPKFYAWWDEINSQVIKHT